MHVQIQVNLKQSAFPPPFWWAAVELSNVDRSAETKRLETTGFAKTRHSLWNAFGRLYKIYIKFIKTQRFEKLKSVFRRQE